MKLQKRDFVFFGLGGIVFLLGSLFTPFHSPGVDAQAPLQEEIQCKTLIIPDETGWPAVRLDVQRGGGGVINLSGAGGAGYARLIITKDGSELVVEGDSGTGRLTANEEDVQFSIIGDDGKSESRLSADEHGGVVSLFNKTGQEVVVLRVSEKGDGVLKTYNSQGEETGSVP